MVWISLFMLAMQASAPAKLIVYRDSGGVAVTDYPSLARCEAARTKIMAAVERDKIENPIRTAPGGAVIIPKQLDMKSFCIPG